MRLAAADLGAAAEAPAACPSFKLKTQSHAGQQTQFHIRAIQPSLMQASTAPGSRQVGFPQRGHGMLRCIGVWQNSQGGVSESAGIPTAISTPPTISEFAICGLHNSNSLGMRQPARRAKQGIVNDNILAVDIHQDGIVAGS